MYLSKTACCAIQEISGLSETKTGEEAMVLFCQISIQKPVKFGVFTANKDALYSFYMFTAAVGREYPEYGHGFAEFLKKHALGDVWESPALTNKAFHRDHANQVWIWMPNNEAVRSWWKLYQERDLTVVAVPVVADTVPIVATVTEYVEEDSDDSEDSWEDEEDDVDICGYGGGL